MRLISHRGNINGKNVELENTIEYIVRAKDLGFEVEIDVWYVDGIYYLGHDFPKIPIEEYFLEDTKFWCHAKNFESLMMMSQNKKIHYFWHEEDNYTLTSKGIIWVYPGKNLIENSICVLPEQHKLQKKDVTHCLGVCSDYIEEFL